MTNVRQVRIHYLAIKVRLWENKTHTHTQTLGYPSDRYSFWVQGKVRENLVCVCAHECVGAHTCAHVRACAYVRACLSRAPPFLRLSVIPELSHDLLPASANTGLFMTEGIMKLLSHEKKINKSAIRCLTYDVFMIRFVNCKNLYMAVKHFLTRKHQCGSVINI